MSVSREHLIGRIAAIQTIMADPVSIDTSPVPTASSAAVAIRNGCMVMLFCALEGFVRDRSLECARSIDQTTVPYLHLPQGLKVASLVATYEGLLNLSRGWPIADKLAAFERASIAAASGSLNSSYQFTDYSFARDKSNIGSEDIAKIARSFGVDNFWSSARTVSQRAGMGLPGNMDETFKQLARERHKAAHVPSHAVTHSFLTAAVPGTLSLAIAFDSLLSAATQRLSISAIAQGVQPALLLGSDVDFIILKPHRGVAWGCFLPSRVKALFVEASFEVAIARAATVARTKGLAMVCQDATGRATTWRTVLG